MGKSKKRTSTKAAINKHTAKANKDPKYVSTKQTSNAPLYFLRSKETGRFYNAITKKFALSIVNATYDIDIVAVQKLVETVDNFKNCEIITVTENELFDHYALTTSNACLVGAYFSQMLVRLEDKLPTVSEVNRGMRFKINSMVKTLSPFTNYYEYFLETEENFTEEISGDLSEFFHLMSMVEIGEDMREVNALLRNKQKQDRTMLELEQFKKNVQEFKENNPEHKEQIDELYQLALEEIEQGGSVSHEISICLSDIEALINEEEE
jgi:hypothetical protein